MKSLAQFRSNLSEVDDKESRKFTTLVRAGLFDAKKLPMLKRALAKDAQKMTPVERATLIDLLDSLMNQVIGNQQVYTKVRQNVMQTEGVDLDMDEAREMPKKPSYDPELGHTVRTKSSEGSPTSYKGTVSKIHDNGKVTIDADNGRRYTTHKSNVIKEETQIDELSQKTMKDYREKASKDAQKTDYKSDKFKKRVIGMSRAENKIKEEYEEISEENINEDSSKSIPVVLVLKRRALRIYPAGQVVALYYADKIDKYVTIPFTTIGMSDADAVAGVNEENLDELSNKTLGSYIEKAQDTIDWPGSTGRGRVAADIRRKRKLKNRSVGITTATFKKWKKPVGEEATLEDGTVVKIDEQFIIKFDDIYSKLNEENREQFITMITQDKNNYQKMMQFVEENSRG